MRSGGFSWIVAMGVPTVAVLTASCDTGAGSTADLATSLPSPASFAAVPGDVIETALELSVGTVGSIDISHFDVSARSGSSSIAFKADVRATALEAIDTLELDYCGPPLTFLSVDGSTVVVTLENDQLLAPLHSPLQADTEFAFRFLTEVPLDHVPELDVGDVVDDLLCR